MSGYRISLDVVRKANERMKQSSGFTDAQGRASRGEFIVSVNTGLGARKFTITNDQIRAAYKKAIAAINAKAI